MIVNSHLIVDMNFAFIFFLKRDESLSFTSHFYFYISFAFSCQKQFNCDQHTKLMFL